MLDCIYKKYCILLSDDLFTFTNSVDTDEMQHYAAFHLDLHCLQKYFIRGFPNTKDYSQNFNPPNSIFLASNQITKFH